MGSEKVRRVSTTIKLNQLKTTVVLAFLAFVLVVVFAASFSRSHRAEGDFRPVPSLKFKSESADVQVTKGNPYVVASEAEPEPTETVIELTKKTTELTKKTLELMEKAREIEQREEALAKREIDLFQSLKEKEIEKAKELGQREEALVERETELSRNEEDYQHRHKDLVHRLHVAGLEIPHHSQHLKPDESDHNNTHHHHEWTYEDLVLMCKTSGNLNYEECEESNLEKVRLKQQLNQNRLNHTEMQKQQQQQQQPQQPQQQQQQQQQRRSYVSTNNTSKFPVGLRRRQRSRVAPHKVDAKEIHSSHTCYGRDHKSHNWERTTCLYHDICYLDTTQTWYYVTQNHFHDNHVSDTKVHEGTNQLTVSLSPNGHSVTGSNDYDTVFSPEIISMDNFTKLVGGKKATYVSNIHVLYVSYNAENFGHFLSDELFPAYSMLEAFDELDYDVQLIRHELRDNPIPWSCEYQRKEWGHVQWEKCMFRYKSLTKLLSRNQVLTVKNYTKKLGGGPICYKKIAAGMGMLADHCYDFIGHGRQYKVRHDCNQGRQTTLASYRSYVMGNIGIPDLHPKKNRVLIWDRNIDDYKKNRKIWGLPDLAKRIERELGVEVLVFEAWHAKTIEYQIRTMASSTIFLTGPGSGSFISWFLPRGSTQIRIYPTSKEEETYLMEWFLFNYMPHMHVEHVNAPNGIFIEDELIELVKVGIHRYDHYIRSKDN